MVAEGGVTAYKLTRQAVNELLGDLGALIKRNMTMKQIPAIQLFKSLSPAEIEVLVDSSADLHFKPGETLIKQGETKSMVYVIKEGKAKRRAADGREDVRGHGVAVVSKFLRVARGHQGRVWLVRVRVVRVPELRVVRFD